MGQFGMALAAAAGLAYTAPAVLAQGQVNGAGATLFVDFFRSPAITNDVLDVDGDGIFGFTAPNIVDQLANSNLSIAIGTFGDDQATETWWQLQYRSVGSVEGFQEFVNFQTCSDLPENIPSERGIFNTRDFAVTGVIQSTGLPQCTDDTDGDTINNGSGTPLCPESIDFGNTDVETPWAVQGATGGTPIWSAVPTAAGYGRNPNTSNGKPGQTGESNFLASLTGPCGSSLNTNIGSPDGDTIFDTRVAFSPVSLIANRGTGLSELSYSDMRHMFVTGRDKSGKNWAVNVRDVGSGTRNAWANSLGIDPSWCVGDGQGIRINTTTLTLPGPNHQVTNCGGSSISESAVQHRRICVGFTGLSGSSRAISDVLSGNYEILDVIKDTDGGTMAVRPKLETVIFNLDVDTGFQIGGLQTFSTVGNPDSNRDPLDPRYNAIDPAVSNQTAADWVNNIVTSIENFQGNPGAPSEQLMPSEFLANTFFLAQAVEALPESLDPDSYVANTVNTGLRDYILANNTANDTPDFGTVNLGTGGRAPSRQANPDFNGDLIVDPYTDGNTTGTTWTYCNNGVNASLTSGSQMSASNKLSADFDRNGTVDANDLDEMLDAIADPRNFDCSDNGGVRGAMVIDVVIPEVIGDLNGDGNLDDEDVRYAADGFILTAGVLDRAANFTAVDVAAAGNYFGTTWGNGATYANGDSRFDVAGNTFVTPGAAPVGGDGVIDQDDIDYVLNNFGDWSNLDEAATMDLSADMNGDLVVDCDDVLLIADKLGVTVPDCAPSCPNNLPGCDNSDIFPAGAEDCIVNLSDLGVVLANFQVGVPGKTRAQGDIFPLGGTGDGIVDLSDLGQVLADFGTNCQ